MLWAGGGGGGVGETPSSPWSSEMEGLRGRGAARSPLVGVGLALLAHVVGGGLAEVQPPHSHFRDLFGGQIDPAEEGQGTQGPGKRGCGEPGHQGPPGQECVGGARCGCLWPSLAPARGALLGTRPRLRHSRDGVEGPLASVRLRLLDVDGLVQGLQLGEEQRPRAPQGLGSPHLVLPSSASQPRPSPAGAPGETEAHPPLGPQTPVPSPTPLRPPMSPHPHHSPTYVHTRERTHTGNFAGHQFTPTHSTHLQVHIPNQPPQTPMRAC